VGATLRAVDPAAMDRHQGNFSITAGTYSAATVQRDFHVAFPDSNKRSPNSVHLLATLAFSLTN